MKEKQSVEVVLAKSAGFCFGVERAVNKVYEQAEKGGNTYTYGPIIHNKEVVEDLEKHGVRVVESADEIAALQEGTVVIRSHGVSRETDQMIRKSGLHCIDATCPFVKRIHRTVEAESAAGRKIVIIGNPVHPEVIGIMGWSSTPVTVIQTEEEARRFARTIPPAGNPVGGTGKASAEGTAVSAQTAAEPAENSTVSGQTGAAPAENTKVSAQTAAAPAENAAVSAKDEAGAESSRTGGGEEPAQEICVVAQTTFNANKFQDFVEILKERSYNVLCVNTICNATHERQSEAKAIAARADIMIVIGDQSSSNSAKLYEICRKECRETYFIQTWNDLHLTLTGAEKVIGITAGASTPKNIIEEVYNHVRADL
ncbi:MAG: 4-hydroxy-3-methylbut-2-enyl diphosphate reductase [Eubacteriales bacterium]|nr:4-hydroxy-3-methylbut-2-enyl diphosphate reductase [Eubacteriales bacterium]